MDHDQRFKALIREFFGDFLRLFFAPWAERFDLGSVEWLDKEVFPDHPKVPATSSTSSPACAPCGQSGAGRARRRTSG
jgi:hypothetical protein